MANSNPENILTWQTFFLVLIGICGVGGMMYYLFTDPAYDGNGGLGIDSSYIAKIDTAKSSVSTASNSGDKKHSKSKKSTEEDNKLLVSKSIITSTKPVEVKPVAEPKPQVPLVISKPVVVAKPQPIVVVKASPIIQPKPVVAAKPVVIQKPLVLTKSQPAIVAKAVPIVQSKPVVAPKPIVIQKPLVLPKPQPAIVTKAAPIVQPKPVVAVKPVVVQKSVAVAKPHPVTKEMATTTSSFVAKPAKKKEVTFKPSTKEDKVMREDELQQLITNILKKGNEEGIYAKCVRLHNTAEGNNKSTLRQVETYLRSNKFVIAGRETVSAHVKGYEVSAIEGCLQLTLGTF